MKHTGFPSKCEHWEGTQDTSQDTKYQKILGEKHVVDAQTAAKNAIATAIKTAYAQLAGNPIEHFQYCQWNALIDHAIVGEDTIRFVFRTGEQVRIALKG